MPIFKDKENKIRRGFNLSKEILDELEEISKSEKRTKSEIVETALEYLFNLIKEEKKANNKGE